MNTNIQMNGTIYSGIPDTVSGSTKGSYSYIPKENGEDSAVQEILPQEDGTDISVQEIAGKITGFGTAMIQGTEAGLSVPKGISGTVNLTINGRVECAQGDVSVTNLTLEGGSIEAKNITVRGTTALHGGYIKAGTAAAGDGGCTLNQIAVSGKSNRIEAKQDKNAVSRLVVNGTVEAAPKAEMISAAVGFMQAAADSTPDIAGESQTGAIVIGYGSVTLYR